MVKYPIGVQTFDDLISRDMLYVDKTASLHRLIEESKQCFLARPRRFGKSLTLSTLSAILRGEKKLLNRLAIAKRPYKWTKHPVVHFSLAGAATSTPDELSNLLRFRMQENAERNGVLPPQQTDPALAFDHLIGELFRRTRKKGVVVLIDEYDKPILDNIGSEQLPQLVRILKTFYAALKNCDEQLRFVFITGVSKFSQVSIHSDLNHLRDLSLEGDYAALCGYTQTEIEQYFPLDSLARQMGWSRQQLLAEIQRWYNGYCFSLRSQERMYNPWSVLNLFAKKEFSCYWGASGTMDPFLPLIARQSSSWSQLDTPVPAHTFSVYNAERISALPLLYQTGYLTIKGQQQGNYLLGFPNYEVESVFSENIIAYATDSLPDEVSRQIVGLQQALAKHDLERFIELLTALYAKIPYQLHLDKESFYHALFLSYLQQVSFQLDAEKQTNQGRIDAVVETPKRVYLFEFKLDQTAEQAIQQIKQKNYPQPFAHGGKPLTLVGINFSSEERNIAGYQSLDL